MRHIAAIVALLFMGCADSSQSELENELEHGPDAVPPSLAPPLEPAVARPPLHLMPADLMTGVRMTPPTVLVDGELQGDEPAQIAAALEIVEWPSRRRVPVRVEIEPRDSAAGRSVHRFVVLPEGAIGERWYALSVDTARLPQRFAGAAGDSPWPGHRVTRFAPHRTTIVSDVAVEPSGAGVLLGVRLSARVQDERPGHELVHVTDARGDVACAAEDGGGLRSPDGTYELRLTCPDAQLPLRLQLDPAIRSLDGVTLGEAYGSAPALDVPLDAAARRVEVARALRLERAAL